MLAVLLFAAFWVVLGLLVFFLGIRGGPSAAVEARPSDWRSRRALGWCLFVIYVAFGIAIPALFLIDRKGIVVQVDVRGSDLRAVVEKLLGE